MTDDAKVWRACPACGKETACWLLGDKYSTQYCDRCFKRHAKGLVRRTLDSRR